jgi:hypothetical protein
MDTPFQHQQIKELLRLCTNCFGRVVILVDDVDILPSDHFHELFRTLRPIGKVPQVRMVVAVPRYFFNAVRSGSLGDVHSTVRQVYMLGDPDRYALGVNGDFSLKFPEYSREGAPSDELRQFFAEYLWTRLRLPITPDPMPGKEAVSCDPISFAVGRWCEKCGKDDWDRVKSFMVRVGASRREIFRETERLLRQSGARPFDFFETSTALREEELDRGLPQMEHLKSEYYRDEASLRADVVVRAVDLQSSASLQRETARTENRPQLDLG